MAVSNDFIAYVLDQLDGLGPLQVRRMFGGAGIYCGDLFFAILADDELYFKANDTNLDDYRCLNLEPFTYRTKNGRTVSLRYYPLPADVLEDREQLHAWARKALAAAKQGKRALIPK